MGWTTYHVNGKIDRKYECDNIYNGETEKFMWEIVKSAMIGSTYYAAVRKTEKSNGKSYVFAGICLTSVDQSKYDNFGYKDMSEDMGPVESKCPASILNLLSQTENVAALAWRERCRSYHARLNPGKLPVGTKISFMMNGKSYTAIKCNPAYQFKTTWWMTPDGHYISKKYIPENFTVI